MNHLKKNIIGLIKTNKKIDIFIICLIIVSTIIVVKFFGRQPQSRIIKVQVVGKDWTENYVNYEGYRPPYWMSGKIKPGDYQLSYDGKKEAEVLKVEEYEHGGGTLDMFLTVTVKGELSKRREKFIYQGQPIETGTIVELHLNRVYVKTQIVDDNVPLSGYPQKQLLVTAREKNVEPWIVNKMKPGLIMTDGMFPVAEVMDVTVEQPTSVIFYNNATNASYTNVFLDRNDTMRDLVLTLKIKVDVINGKYHFAGHQNIKVGNQLWLYFPEVNFNSAFIQNVE